MMDQLPPQHMPLREFGGANVKMSTSPLPTAWALTLDAFADGAPWSPRDIRHAVRTRLRRRDVEALTPFVRYGWSPVAASSPSVGAKTLADDLDNVLAADPDELRRQVFLCQQREEAEPHLTPQPWDRVLEDTEGWMRAYVGALWRSWDVLAPLWERASALIEREVERVGAALAVGAGAELFSSLHPRSSVVGDDWRLPYGAPAGLARLRAAQPVVICPLLTPPSVCLTGDDDAGLFLSMYYPLPGAWRVFDGHHAPPSSLEALLGAQRTTILLALDRPSTIGAIAERLYMVPSAATHHVKALESAGLAIRVRQGRNVLVERTARGTGLLALYE